MTILQPDRGALAAVRKDAAGLLTSSQLAAYVHLPNLETVGFAVTAVPTFDVAPPRRRGDDDISLGAIIDRSRPTGSSYSVGLRSLTRHAFVAGVTGSGKTNTIFHLLRQTASRGVPFLVIEPAKAEYRAMLDDPAIGEQVRVYTPGNELVAPFRLNPFEVLQGTPVSVHLDLLRSVFTASFGMWTPLPQVLEQCLYRIYEDRGWDITTNRNARLDQAADTAAAFPTLSDLQTKVDEVIRSLGYEARISDDMRAALQTRINGLRTGGKGRMLDVRRSMPIDELLRHPTVLELEGMGDDDDKAFMMGMIVIRLAEHRRACGERDGLEHLLVIEEAHRLLSNVGPRAREEEASPRGKAVEMFANLLSEVRAYGQGVIVADQVPVKLAPDVIKNTNLKVAHRVVADDDRAALAGAMAMDERQARALATLTLGEAAVFAELDDAPLLTMVPPAKGASLPDDARVAAQIARLRAAQPGALSLLPFAACAEVCRPAAQACQEARRIVEDPAFQSTFARIALSAIEDPGAVDRMWPDLQAVVSARQPPRADTQALWRCIAVQAAEHLAARRGAQARWTYTETGQLADALRRLVLAKIDGRPADQPGRLYQQRALALLARPYEPFPACGQICRAQPPTCLYRHAAADLIARGALAEAWRQADGADAPRPDRAETWQVCQDAGYELVEWPEPAWPEHTRQATMAAACRACLCFAQQMLARDARKSPRTARKIMDKILKEAPS